MNKCDSTIESIKNITLMREQLIQTVKESLINKKCTHIETKDQFTIAQVTYDSYSEMFIVHIYRDDPNNTAKIRYDRVIIHE